MAGLGTAARRSLARAAAPVAVFGVTVALGVAPALADPGNGNGAAASHSTNGTGGTFGDPTTSQPRQQPDNQGHGANTFPGPYSSTRDGSPSLNGKGDGLAVGQPCAACVGKADNKNPPGQFPNGGDPNAGYECDRNNGIGQTNPAHTGCTTTAATPAGVPSAAARSAQLDDAVSVPSVSLPDALPFTGSSVLVLLFLGVASLAVGGALLALRRLRFRARNELRDAEGADYRRTAPSPSSWRRAVSNSATAGPACCSRSAFSFG
ncbi:MAG TPA: hypothetical protein VKH36_07570 [Acidimicrobiia bacterium]|nr:hypothetical protein [Acidimicrobiia bacterium]